MFGLSCRKMAGRSFSQQLQRTSHCFRSGKRTSTQRSILAFALLVDRHVFMPIHEYVWPRENPEETKANGSHDGITSARRSEEHTSEFQSHSFISYAVFCLKKKKK